MDKTDVYKSLVEIGNAITLAETCIKHKYKLPDILIARLNKLGDLGSDIEAYARATGDKNIIKEIDQLPRAALHQVNGWYAIEQQTRLSIALCNRSLCKVANMRRPQQIQETNRHYIREFKEGEGKKLFDALKESLYIDKSTDYNHFIFWFSGNNASTESNQLKPIIWCNTQILLGYFIDSYFGESGVNHWAIAEKVFILKSTNEPPKAEVLKKDVSSRKDNGRWDKVPKGSGGIDKIVMM